MGRHLLTLITCLMCGAGFAMAQDLYVHTANGFTRLGQLSDIEEITFGENETTVTLLDGTSASFSYTDFEAFSFSPDTPTTVLNTLHTNDNVTIYSVAGTLVRENASNDFDLSTLPGGVYIVKTSTETHKVMIK